MDGESEKVLEFRTDSGELLLRLKMIVKDDSPSGAQKEERTPNKGSGGNGGANGEKKKNNSGANHPPMTDAQKRYLFRLLAANGLEKDAAYEELKKAFGVDSLKDVTKLEASREIEKRLAVQKGGGANGRV
jgi:hypothetical protein